MRIPIVATGLLVFAGLLRLWLEYVAWENLNGLSLIYGPMTILARVGFVVVGLIVIVGAWQDAGLANRPNRFLLIGAALLAALIVFVPA